MTTTRSTRRRASSMMMMMLFRVFAAVVVVDAFASTTHRRLSSTTTTTTPRTTASFIAESSFRGRGHERDRGRPFAASSSDEAERIRRAGCGTDINHPTGSRSLFDPAEAGKLGGTGTLNERIVSGHSYAPIPVSVASPRPAAIAIATSTAAHTTALPLGVDVYEAQHHLEHLDLPLNYAKPSNPATATVLARTRLIGPNAPGDIQHIVMRLPEGMHYVEGQSISVLPPGTDPSNGRPYAPRLYSIASTRYGDALDGRTVSLCVRRAEYVDPRTGMVDPEKKGVCSNYLCDAIAGQDVAVAGPVGKTMVLPSDPNADVVMVATGTGIAPFRAFMHRLFMERTVARHMFGGTAWLVLGVPTTDGLLYKEEMDAMLKNARPGQLQIDYAISREMTNPIDGGKMYVQHVIATKADELFRRIHSGAHVYFCGLRGMMPPILDTLEQVASERGVDWTSTLKKIKDEHRWHVEVY